MKHGLVYLKAAYCSPWSMGETATSEPPVSRVPHTGLAPVSSRKGSRMKRSNLERRIHVPHHSVIPRAGGTSYPWEMLQITQELCPFSRC